MAEAAAASPGHSYDFIPSYLPAPRSAQADIFASPETSEVSSLPERRLQMIYWISPTVLFLHIPPKIAKHQYRQHRNIPESKLRRCFDIHPETMQALQFQP